MHKQKVRTTVDIIRSAMTLAKFEPKKVEEVVDVLTDARKVIPVTDHTSKMERPYTRSELIHLLGKSGSTIDRLTRNGVIKRIDGGRGRAIAYDAESVNALLKGGAK